MLDHRLRAHVRPITDTLALRARALGIRPLQVTLTGLAIGLAAAAAVASGHWTMGAILWLVNRLLDGIDGPLARLERPTELGGYIDFVADYVVYLAIPVAVVISAPNLATAVVVLLSAYLINIVQLLTQSSISAERGDLRDDDRSLRLHRGLVEGAETIVAYTILLLAPQWAREVIIVFAGAVLVTAAQRFIVALRTLER